jgi:acyl-CoA-dependent ceramide synthase
MDATKRRKTQPKKAADEGLLAALCTLICEHQIGMPSPTRDLGRN